MIGGIHLLPDAALFDFTFKDCCNNSASLVGILMQISNLVDRSMSLRRLGAVYS